MPQQHDLESTRESSQQEPPISTTTLSLEKLSHMNASELEALYRVGGVPTSLRRLEGRLPGRILAVEKVPEGLPSQLIRRFAKSRLFPWIGKSFKAFDDVHGQGINRLRGLGERVPFDLRFDTSLIDEGPCILIDYDRSENPAFARAVRDELREVSPGLFMGPSFVRDGRGGARRILFFACANPS